MAEIIIPIEDELCTDEVLQFAEEIKQCVDLYSKKNHDYGNSFDKGMDTIGMSYGVGRIYDKINRIITLTKLKNIQETPRVDESITDTLKDLACYSIMLIMYLKHAIDDCN